MNLRPMHVAIAIAMVPLLHGCRGCTPNPEVDRNLQHLVWMKYAHVANVHEMEAPAPSGTVRLTPTEHGFWAVFDICTLDVQGSALPGFNYDANNFYVDGGTVSYGPPNPGPVNVSGTGRSSNDADVRSLVHDALKLGPETQYFPKQFYPTLRYRIAVYVREYPSGYQGEAMTLKYGGNPAMVQDVSPGKPDDRPFFQYSASPPIASTCP